jgi:membrane-associated phospholipid phosphatase
MRYEVTARYGLATLKPESADSGRRAAADQSYLTPCVTTWLVAGSIVIVCMIWIMSSGFSFTLPYHLWLVSYPVGILIVTHYYGKRRAAPHIRMMCSAGLGSILFFIIYTAVITILSYLVASLNFPLYDRELAQWDAAIGFDWKAFLGWVNSHPLIGKILIWSYHSSIIQLVVIILLLSMTMKISRLQELCDLYVMTSLVTIVLSGLFPAAGAYAYHAPEPMLFNSLNPNAGLWHIEHYEGLRNGSYRLIELGQMQGLVTFPSFHTCFAITLAWCFRDFRWLFPIAIAFCGAVLLSTLTEGGHYLVDVLAGIVITIACIVLRQMFVSVSPNESATAHKRAWLRDHRWSSDDRREPGAA